MTHAFGKRVKPRKFQRGDIVLKVLKGLINDPRGNFRPSWSGPYVIKDLTREEATWLTDPNGNQFMQIMVRGWVAIILSSHISYCTPIH